MFLKEKGYRNADPVMLQWRLNITNRIIKYYRPYLKLACQRKPETREPIYRIWILNTSV
jgi:hypothetical protein